ncbi:hypothetical protein [Rhodococcus phenolicus]|uniref:hypothetical protein n=1 Tax=Rhodococcus phenolicus TaxID=263849 RepID=UPI000833B38B|nr:hypothetical protein [Rhodococcus phenolicus]
MAASTDPAGVDLSDMQDAPNAQPLIHTTYGTATAPEDGEFTAETITPEGVELNADDYDEDGVVDALEAELPDGTIVGYSDVDGDGTFDSVRYATEDYKTFRTEIDTDGDGRIDTVITYDADYESVTYTDEDGDGLADRMYSSETGEVTDLS